MGTYNVGIIGAGTVGAGVYRQLKKKASLIKERTGILVKILGVCDKNVKVLNSLKVPKSKVFSSYEDMLKSPDIDCIIELVGGTKIAEKIILDAFKAGKDVVTANKALLSEKNESIFSAAIKYERQIFFEASVAGGIPIIKGVREALVSNRISNILGIINGTCNYILTMMSHENMGFKEALKLAQKKGYAEADPTLDVGGGDSAHKIAILSELAFGKKVKFEDIPCEGITKIEAGDISFADQFGYVVKLLAVGKKIGDTVEVRVEPVLLKKDHILANVNDSYNAVYLMCDDAENLLFYGRGAGEKPTASAVVSDVVDLARNAFSDRMKLAEQSFKYAKIAKTSSLPARFYIRISAIDEPGVLAKIANILGRNHVSISDMIQQERKKGQPVPLVFLTHKTDAKHVYKSLDAINKLETVKGEPQVLRIEE